MAVACCLNSGIDVFIETKRIEIQMENAPWLYEPSRTLSPMGWEIHFTGYSAEACEQRALYH
jgi:hypothetical protein